MKMLLNLIDPQMIVPSRSWLFACCYWYALARKWQSIDSNECVTALMIAWKWNATFRNMLLSFMTFLFTLLNAPWLKWLCLRVIDWPFAKMIVGLALLNSKRCIREGRINERPRGGVNNIRVDEEMRDCLDDIINENCLLTLSRINHELRTRLPGKPRIHDRTVARAFDGMLFRVKLVRHLPADRNRADVLQKRIDYADLCRPTCRDV